MNDKELPEAWREPVPVLDLKAEMEPIRRELFDAIDSVFEDVSFCNGPAVASFEQSFAEYCGSEECVAVNTGTSALHLAMGSLGIAPGDEVITVSMSFIATAWPILYLRARPVFVDIDRERYTMDPTQLEGAITAKTKAIVPVHLYGQCADMDPILEIAGARGIPVIEDCAQAHGAEYKGRRAGTMGVMGCFSFYPSKNLGGCGEGGALTLNDPDLARRLRRLRDHAQKERYVHEDVGYNYRMNSFQGAVLSVRLRHLETSLQARAAAADEYHRLFADVDVIAPRPCPDGRHVYHQYVIRHDRRDGIRESLAKRGIATGLHYPIPIHLQDPFRPFGFRVGSYPVTEEVAKTCLSLPMHPLLLGDQIERVADAVRSAIG